MITQRDLEKCQNFLLFGLLQNEQSICQRIGVTSKGAKESNLMTNEELELTLDSLNAAAEMHQFCFFKWAKPGLFFVCFCPFLNTLTNILPNLTTNKKA